MTGIVIHPNTALYLTESLELLGKYIEEHECPPSVDIVEFENARVTILTDLYNRIAQLKAAIVYCTAQQGGEQ